MWVKGRHQLGKLMMLLQSSKADIDDQRPSVRFWPKADINPSILRPKSGYLPIFWCLSVCFRPKADIRLILQTGHGERLLTAKSGHWTMDS